MLLPWGRGILTSSLGVCLPELMNKIMGMTMSLEVLEQLEAKVQAAVDNIALLKMELEELKTQNLRLKDENQQLRNDHQAWQDRLRALLGKMDQMDEAV